MISETCVHVLTLSCHSILSFAFIRFFYSSLQLVIQSFSPSHTPSSPHSSYHCSIHDTLICFLHHLRLSSFFFLDYFLAPRLLFAYYCFHSRAYFSIFHWSRSFPIISARIFFASMKKGPSICPREIFWLMPYIWPRFSSHCNILWWPWSRTSP